MGQAMQTRNGMEFVALYFALFIALMSVGWFVIQPVAGRTDQILTEGWPSLLSTAFRALPSGWGIVAVDAAHRAEWGLVVGVFLAFVVLIGGLLLVWAALLARSLSSKPASHSVRSSATSTHAAPYRWLPLTQVGAVIARELHTWERDPWRALELRIALWTGLLIGAIPLLIGVTDGLPFVGIVIAIMGGVVSGNLPGLDGSALWQKLLTPGAERIDVRGRQWAWLLIFAPVSFAATIVFTALSGRAWAWPLVLSLLLAGLGGTVGLVALFSVFFPSPGIDPRMRKNPMDSSGEMLTEIFFMPWRFVGLGIGIHRLPAAGGQRA
jgi:ABC-2 type transport system permease protein